MEKRYRVVNDLQGGEFGMGRDFTIEEWREQAIEWADSDENDDLIDYLYCLKPEKVIDCIAEIWQLEFEQIDVYNYQYDYDDIKIAVVIAETFKDWNVFCDYEDVAQLVIMIKDKWKEYQPHGWLTEEEFAYMQKWAINYLNENKVKIMEELR